MDKKIAEGFAKGLSDLEIADKLGVSWRLVQNTRYALGLFKRARRGLAVDKDRIILMVREGISDKTIAQTVGCSLSTVSRYRHKEGIYIGTRNGDLETFNYLEDLNNWLASIKPQHVPESKYKKWLKTPTGQEFLEQNLAAKKRADDYPEHQRSSYGATR